MPLIIDKSDLDKALNSPNGDVGKHLYKQALLIQAAAKRQVGVRSGALRSSISINRGRDSRGLFVEVGSKLPHARAHHEGTKPHLITPNNRKMLRFTSKGRIIFARQVRHPGTRANKYLSDNLRLVR
jgi:hypothetical protein